MEYLRLFPSGYFFGYFKASELNGVIDIIEDQLNLFFGIHLQLDRPHDIVEIIESCNFNYKGSLSNIGCSQFDDEAISSYQIAGVGFINVTIIKLDDFLKQPKYKEKCAIVVEFQSIKNDNLLVEKFKDEFVTECFREVDCSYVFYVFTQLQQLVSEIFNGRRENQSIFLEDYLYNYSIRKAVDYEGIDLDNIELHEIKKINKSIVVEIFSVNDFFQASSKFFDAKSKELKFTNVYADYDPWLQKMSVNYNFMLLPEIFGEVLISTDINFICEEMEPVPALISHTILTLPNLISSELYCTPNWCELPESTMLMSFLNPTAFCGLDGDAIMDYKSIEPINNDIYSVMNAESQKQLIEIGKRIDFSFIESVYLANEVSFAAFVKYSKSWIKQLESTCERSDSYLVIA